MALHRLAILPLAVMLHACAAAPAPVPFDLYTGEPDAARIDAQFAAEMSARYGPNSSRESIVRDLDAQGFQCADVPPVEARGDYLLARCTLAKPHGLCTNQWAVEVRYASQGAARAQGSFRRPCVGPAAPAG